MWLDALAQDRWFSTWSINVVEDLFLVEFVNEGSDLFFENTRLELDLISLR